VPLCVPVPPWLTSAGHRAELIAKGLKFTSETDTEVIAKLVGLYLDEKMDTKNALKYALNRSVSLSLCLSH
jgi:glucosamine 6-phosphate synthetase-like amidotransferase/phosphosugar isomerase protein